MSEIVEPTAIRLEAASHYQLRCPSCPTTSGAIDAAIGRGYLRAADFRALLERNPEVRAVELSNYGEVFLNPELQDILRIGHERGVLLSAHNGVNLNTAREGVLEDVVRYQLHSMTCSIDGATQETYARYRVRGSLAAVLDNIRAINALKRKHRSIHPRLSWQFVIFGHNEHEIPAARRLAAELRMDFSPKLTWDDAFSPIRDKEWVLRETGLDAASRDEYRREFGEDYAHGTCQQLWVNPQIKWDGKLLGCCRNFWRDFGANVFADGLRQAVNGEPIRYARAMLTGSVPARADIPCTTCEVYLGMKADGRWLQSTPPRVLDRAQVLARAARFLALGRLVEAEGLYLMILQAVPNEGEALRGIARVRQGLGWDDGARTPTLETTAP